ncbi:carbohydrate-binding domain-containing protein [Clostridium sp.]|uniref:carbohydrate-binding domain-containing protein n=1 Tax=Clostridium sp. TaxID=1506 RepID=UPI003F3C46D2
MKRKLVLILTAVSLCAAIIGCSKKNNNDNLNINSNNVAAEAVSESSTTIILGDEISVNGNGVVIDNNIVKITAAGTYEVTGTLKDGQIIIEAGDEDNVDITLNGVNITSSNSSPIYSKNAKNTTLILAYGTDNILTDSENYTYDDVEKEEPNATIFSKCDLKIKGSGSLVVNGNFNNGIASKDDLEIKNGNITVNAVNDGIKGKDSIEIADGNITVNCSGDSLQSSNDTDETKGYIAIDGGVFNLNSKTTENLSLVSAKGIKAITGITINAGEFNINSSDDAIHSNNSVIINGGLLNLTTGDDGIHADATLDINGGEINVLESYEGLESEVININGGNITVVASDDGINAAGGNDSEALGGGREKDHFMSSGNGSINFNDGYVYVDAKGDGIDANGSINMTGGVVIVNGPTDNGNGALDYDKTCNVNGGLLIAAGSLGMMQSPSSSSTLNSVAVMLNSQEAKTLIHIEDEEGNEVITFAPSKTYQSLVVSSPNIKTGSSYKVFLGGSSTGSEKGGLYSNGLYSGGEETLNFTVSENITTAAQAGISQNQMGPGGGGGQIQPGGFKPR